MQGPDTLFDSDTQDQIKRIINLGQVQKALMEYGNNILPVPEPRCHEQPVSRGGPFHSRLGRKDPAQTNCSLKWKGPWQVLLSTPTSQIPGHPSCAHLSGITLLPPESSQVHTEDKPVHCCELRSQIPLQKAKG